MAHFLLSFIKTAFRSRKRKGKSTMFGFNVFDLKFLLKRKGGNSGFSLIEVLIAMALVFFLLVGLAEMFCYSILLKQKADTQRIAADVISEKIETLKSLGPEDPELLPGNYQEMIKDKNSERVFLLKWEISVGEKGLKKILFCLYPGKDESKSPTRAIFFLSHSLQF